MGALEVKFDEERWEKEAKSEFKVLLKKFGVSGLQDLKQFLTEGTALVQKWFDPLVIISGAIGGFVDKSNMVDNLVNKWGEKIKTKLIELIDELLIEIQKEGGVE